MNFKTKHSEEELRKFVKQNLSEIDCVYISAYQKLSENFIREFQDKVNWVNISGYQNLSENFIREFKNKVDWYYISICQNLSEDFIREFKNKVDWYALRYNTKIQVSDEFTIEFDKKLGYDNVWLINNGYHRILGFAKIFKNEKEYWYRGKQAKVNSDEEYFEWLKYKYF